MGSKHKIKTSIDIQRFLALVPLYFSYVVLLSTWLAFMLFVTINEILLKRGDAARFVEQMVIYNTLLGLTMVALITASNRSPGRPDQSLALLSHRRPVNRDSTLRSIPEPAYSPRLEAQNEDDIPLKYLRNSTWNHNRTTKDRPSPLPLPRRSLQGVVDTSTGLVGAGSSVRHQTNTNREIGFENDSLNISELSPFPFGRSPFVPKTLQQAGEGQEERAESRFLQEAVEGIDNAYDVPITSNSEMDSLLLTGETYVQPNNSVIPLFAKSNSGLPRFCTKCDSWKPDRCHHCRYCKACTLKMDHHCIWIGNCVGYNNYKPFLLFISYGALLSIYIALEAGYESYRFFINPGDYAPVNPGDPVFSDLAPAVFMLLTILGIFFALSVGSLASYHWWLASNNLTTLENMTHSYPSALLAESNETVGREWRADHLLSRSERNRIRKEARDINVYDLGWRRNLSTLLAGEEQSKSYLASLSICLWPPAVPRSRMNAEAGHVSPYDREALERLRHLTAELRLGVVEGQDDLDHGSEEEEDESDGYMTELEEDDVGIEGGNQEGTVRKVAWFEA